MAETVYLETSIFGYLTARPSQNLILVANVGVTREWWSLKRADFRLYASEFVVEEVSKGDPEMASERLKLLKGITLLPATQSATDLAIKFLNQSSLPPDADVDALHIAIASVQRLDYLLTWNCKHIANAQIQKKLAQISGDFGFKLPILCTPYELLGD
ncbi:MULTISPECIES: type II toxin-antitoxin system VapC family toxin [Synechocystis]|uniref:Type II toxin-antitoxin system VapC family toxin n=1 Tax=Synechocystis salina LEGE 00031 TaxID=1828736 RepID=A0ABR9VVG9_9SYNC|nr:MULTISPECIES: type II toxin-antitoxin system VapC family toxin [Synechocystis]MBE9195669.1 type II toxin-antitoxin system VapC family toxin [Synechocystis sp. LEGE 06083]MBE9242157.1 type II toxin-antitoxin system VapC family toxin [Synechocystis salina LEGE 00041]MBE9255347.1 type II toxin-antitoxin system VapC family toxin [Synechocystis salina LEGE 00031]